MSITSVYKHKVYIYSHAKEVFESLAARNRRNLIVSVSLVFISARRMHYSVKQKKELNKRFAYCLSS